MLCEIHFQAAILQQTAEYIFSLEQEKTRLLQQNAQLKRFIQVPSWLFSLPGVSRAGEFLYPLMESFALMA